MEFYIAGSVLINSLKTRIQEVKYLILYNNVDANCNDEKSIPIVSWSINITYLSFLMNCSVLPKFLTVLWKRFLFVIHRHKREKDNFRCFKASSLHFDDDYQAFQSKFLEELMLLALSLIMCRTRISNF